MFYQTDEYFNQKINLYGCNFFCLLKISEMEAYKLINKRFGREEILNIYKIAEQQGYMTKDCYINSPDNIIDLGYRYLTSRHITAYQVGAIEDGKTNFWGWVKGKYKKYRYRIIRWKTYNDNEHFTLADKNGKEIYDPYHKDIKDTKKQELLYYIGD